MPNGDLESMAKLKEHAHRSTVLFLNIPRAPVDTSTLWWNAHRVSGDKLRWRWLTHGWKGVGNFGDGDHGWNPSISVFRMDVKKESVVELAELRQASESHSFAPHVAVVDRR